MTAGDRRPEPAARSVSAASRRVPASVSLVQVRTEWTAFYDANYNRVVRFMIHALGASFDDAQDAAQEAFTESWKLMSRDPGGWRAIENKEAWIRTIALRRHARPPGARRRPLTARGRGIPDWPAPGPDHSELTAQAQAVLQALRCLDDESRAVMAFSLDHFTTADIAGALNITPQRVRDVKKKARATLRRRLAEGTAAEGRHHDH
jgi:RNA polymerase sigma factor (sigma-70 family)